MAYSFKLIEAKSLGSNTASIEFTSIPSTYTDLLVMCSLRSSVDGDGIYLKFNGSTSSYSHRMLTGSGSAASSQTPGQTDKGALGYTTTTTASTFGNLSVYIPNYTSSNNKSWSADGVQEANATAAYMNMVAGLWSNTSAITSLTVLTDNGVMQTNSSFYLYGISNS
jgi:hypothetical protein